MRLLRDILASAFLALACVGQAFGQAQPSQLLLNATGWAWPGAYSDMDFANGRYYRPLTLTDTRAQSNSGLSTAQDLLGHWISFQANTLRQTNRGILIEEGRTNAIRNAIATGSTPGVLGAGGVLPTNWSISFGTTGLTNANVTVGTLFTDPTGVQLLPITINGTATAAGSIAIIFDNGTSTSNAGYGQTYTGSAFDQLVSGTLSGAQSNFEIDGLASGTFVAGTTSTPYTLTSTLTRENASSTLTGSTVNQVRLQYHVILANAATPNFTFNLGWPQIENNNNVFAAVASAVVNTAGSGFTGTSGTMTWSGAGCSTNPVLNVTASGGAITGVTSVAIAGACTVLPAPAATTWTSGGSLSGGSGASFTPTGVNNAALGTVSSPVLSQGTATSSRAGDYILVSNPQFVPALGGFWMYWSFTPTFNGQLTPVLGGVANALTFANQVFYATGSFTTFSSASAVGATGGGVVTPGAAGSIAVGSPAKEAASWYLGSAGLGANIALNGFVSNSGGWTAFPSLVNNFFTIGSAPWNAGSNQINAYMARFAVGLGPLPPARAAAMTTLNGSD